MAESIIKNPTLMPAVGDVIVTGDSSNPQNLYSGFGNTTWELIDKRFKKQHITTSATVFTRNTTNVSSISSVFARMQNHSVFFRIQITAGVAMTTTRLELGTINLTNVGFNSQSCYLLYNTAMSSDGAGVVMYSLQTDGKIYYEGCVCKRKRTTDGIASGKTFTLYLEVPCTVGQMGNSFCDRFYWKRTA